MKTFITLLIGGSLALAGAVMAQQPPGQESPAKKGGGAATTEKAGKAPRSTEAKPTGNATGAGEKRAGRNAMGAEKPMTTTETGATGANQAGGGKYQRGAKSQATTTAESSPAGGATGATTGAEQGMGRGKGKGRNAKENAATAGTGAAASPGMSASSQAEQGEAGKRGRGAKAAGASPSPAAATAAAAASASVPPTTGASPATSATIAAGANANAQGATGATMTKEQGTVGRGGKKVEAQQVQQIKQQHASFRAQARPDRAPAVTFQANRRIEGAERWQGPQYEVFRSYHPEWHDQGWYRQRYGRVELIGGGYYFFNQGYWYPAWGYDNSAAYYPYDGPIYVGHQSRPPDQVIADVQAELQQMGYYTGEVDGLLGPLTRQALRDYQADHGLMVTEVIDEPTLDALQLS